MTDVLEFNKPARIREQASLWLIRLQEGLRAEHEQELSDWLAIDAAHAEQLLELAAVWDELEVLTELAPLFEGFSLSSALKSDNERSPKVSSPRHLAVRAAQISVAASLLLALSSYWVFNNSMFRSVDDNPLTSKLELSESAPRLVEPNAKYSTGVIFKTAKGEQLTANLSDGSIATLNTDTHIKVSFNVKQRMIQLTNGEVHFKVAKDPSRPLKVLVSGKSVQAVGTAFSVRKRSATDIEVAVDEGVVAVYKVKQSNGEQDAALPVSLDAGDVLTIDDEQSQLSEYDTDQMQDRLAWRNGMIVINDETLNYVIEEFSRYSEQKVLLADRKMGEIRVAGYFRLGDMDALLVALEQNFKIRSEYYSSNNTFVLSQLNQKSLDQ